MRFTFEACDRRDLELKLTGKAVCVSYCLADISFTGFGIAACNLCGQPPGLKSVGFGMPPFSFCRLGFRRRFAQVGPKRLRGNGPLGRGRLHGLVEVAGSRQSERNCQAASTAVGGEGQKKLVWKRGAALRRKNTSRGRFDDYLGLLGNTRNNSRTTWASVYGH